MYTTIRQLHCYALFSSMGSPVWYVLHLYVHSILPSAVSLAMGSYRHQLVRACIDVLLLLCYCWRREDLGKLRIYLIIDYT